MYQVRIKCHDLDNDVKNNVKIASKISSEITSKITSKINAGDPRIFRYAMNEHKESTSK